MIQKATNMTQEEKDSVEAFGYGHIGDGNLHLNVSLTGYDNKSLQEKVNDIVDPFVMDYVRQRRGSVSAEHGIGL